MVAVGSHCSLASYLKIEITSFFLITKVWELHKSTQKKYKWFMTPYPLVTSINPLVYFLLVHKYKINVNIFIA